MGAVRLPGETDGCLVLVWAHHAQSVSMTVNLFCPLKSVEKLILTSLMQALSPRALYDAHAA